MSLFLFDAVSSRDVRNYENGIILLREEGVSCEKYRNNTFRSVKKLKTRSEFKSISKLIKQ